MSTQPYHESDIPAVPQEWPEPESLTFEIPPVIPFTHEMLPEALRGFAFDVSERLEVPPEMPATALICALAGVVGRRAFVQPKQRDTRWREALNLWGGTVASPGMKKSPTSNECFRPLRQLQKHLNKIAAERYAQLLKKNEQAEKDKHRTDEELRREAYDGTKVLVNDATPQKLHELMSQNPQGLFLERDELAGLFETQKQNGREGERQLYLACWNGNQSYTYCTLSRGEIDAICCLSMYGSIQPDVLSAYLTAWFGKGFGNDGFAQRFQLLVWPDSIRPSGYIDIEPNAEASSRFVQAIRGLITLDPAAPILLRFAPEAQPVFISCYESLQKRVHDERINPILRSHLSKYAGLACRLAALYTLADLTLHEGFKGFQEFSEGVLIPRLQLERAISCVNCLESHANRIYWCVINPQVEPAVRLASHISQGKLSDEELFTVAKITSKEWGGLNQTKIVLDALELLCQTHWVRKTGGEKNPKGGRPTVHYQVNPNAIGRAVGS